MAGKNKPEIKLGATVRLRAQSGEIIEGRVVHLWDEKSVPMVRVASVDLVYNVPASMLVDPHIGRRLRTQILRHGWHADKLYIIGAVKHLQLRWPHTFAGVLQDRAESCAMRARDCRGTDRGR